jgi:hypothetical protein
MATENSQTGGVSLLGAMFLIFLILKLCKVIDWSWWLVTYPLWGPFALIVLVFMIGGLLKLARG